MKPRNSKYGWKPDTGDQRDYKLKLGVAKLPPAIDLRAGMPPVYDQGQLGSCTANATAAVYDYQLLQEGHKLLNPSRLFQYYNERAADHTAASDAGSTLRQAMKVLAKLGAVPETEWPYIIRDFAVKPSAQAYQDAAVHIGSTYARVNPSLIGIKTALVHQLPVVFGFSVYESFESPETARTGIMSMPKNSEALLGGHATVMVGYDDAKQWFIVRNSWGPNWGSNGYFYMPYKYVTKRGYCSDFWALTSAK